MHVPFCPESPTAAKPARTMLAPQHKRVEAELKAVMFEGLIGRLVGQAFSSASTWLYNPFPGGMPQTNATWHTMIR